MTAIAISPITPQVTLNAQRDEVAKGVSYGMQLGSEFAERTDVMHIQLLPVLFRCLPAVLTNTITNANRTHGWTPRWTVVRKSPPQPRWTIFPALVAGSCLALARAGAVFPTLCLTRFDREDCPAFWARHRHRRGKVNVSTERPPLVRMRFASDVFRLPKTKTLLGTKTSINRRNRRECRSALLTRLLKPLDDITRLHRAGNRAVRARPTFQISKRLPALGTCRLRVNGGISVLAFHRAVDARMTSIRPVPFTACRTDTLNSILRLRNSSCFHKAKYIARASQPTRSLEYGY